MWALQRGSSTASLLPMFGQAHQTAGWLNEVNSALSFHGSLVCTAASDWSEASESKSCRLQDNQGQSLPQQAWSQLQGWASWVTCSSCMRCLRNTRTFSFASDLLCHERKASRRKDDVAVVRVMLPQPDLAALTGLPLCQGWEQGLTRRKMTGQCLWWQCPSQTRLPWASLRCSCSRGPCCTA